MWKNIWKNRLEFYPYLSILLFWFVGSFLCALLVKNRPGIMVLGVVTIPSITLVAIAVIKTYKQLL